jgi:hypothetical protein
MEQKDLMQALVEIAKSLDKNNVGVDQESYSGYINEEAAVLVKALTGVTPTVYDNGQLIEKERVEIIEKSAEEFQRDRAKTGRRAEIVYNHMLTKDPLLGMISTKIGSERTISIDEYISLKDTLIFPEVDSSATSAVTQNAGLVGHNIYLALAQQRYNILVSDIRNNLFNPNWLANQKAIYDSAWSFDVARAAVRGVKNSGGTVLVPGFETTLKTAKGQITTPQGTTITYGANGHFLTPTKVNATDLSTSALVLAAMDNLHAAMINNEDTNRFITDGTAVYMMSPKTALLYRNGRSASTTATPIGINTDTRDAWKTLGANPAYNGINVFESIHFSDDVIILGNPRNFIMGLQNTIEENVIRVDRNSGTGMKYEFTKEYYMGFDIVNRNAMAIAYSGAKIETPKASTTAGNIYTAYVDGSGADDVYISCDTPGVVIYYASAADKLDDLADAVANGTLIKNGGKVTVSADTYVRAFRTDGTITDSDILTIDIAS